MSVNLTLPAPALLRSLLSGLGLRGRLRMSTGLMLGVVYLAGMALLWLGEREGSITSRLAQCLSGGMLATATLFFVLVHTRLSMRWGDPGLGLPQVVASVAWFAVLYAALSGQRSLVLLGVQVIFVFSIFGLDKHQLSWAFWSTVAMLLVVMPVMVGLDPQHYPWREALVHFVLTATALVVALVLAQRWALMRETWRRQQAELTHAMHRLHDLRNFDDLTALPNRRYAQSHWPSLIEACDSEGAPLTIAWLDLTEAQAVGERYGPALVDTLLRGFAAHGKTLLGESDWLVRWDEQVFLWVWPGKTVHDAAWSAQSLNELTERQTLHVRNTPLRLHFYSGITAHRRGESIEHTLARAELACLQAKLDGDTRIEVVL